MAYNQKKQAGRGNMCKTGKGIPLNMKSPLYKQDPPAENGKKYVNVKTIGDDDKEYSISVAENSPYAKLSNKMGSLPKSMKSVVFNSKTDPSASGITPEESKKRKMAYNKSVGR